MLGAVGCNNSDAPAVPDPDMVHLCLDISFDGQEGTTRAGNDPTGYENPSGDFEKISTLRVIIVRDIKTDETTGVETGVVEANRLVSTTDEGTPINDNLEFKVIANELKRIYLVANEKFLPVPADFTTSLNPTVMKFFDNLTVQKEVNLSTLTYWTFSLPGITETTTEVTTGVFPATAETSSPRLPLTEFFDVNVDRKKAIDQQFYAHLFLTRTAAKAKFFLTTSDNFVAPAGVIPTIESISLSGVGTSAYVFPYKTTYSPKKEDLIVNTIDYSGELKAYIDNFSTPEGSRTVTYSIKNINEPVQKPKNEEVEYMNLPQPIALGKPITDTFYFPESIVGSQDYIVAVKLTDGTILSAPLTDNILNIAGKGKAIARNTYLPITIEFVGAMAIKVDVLNWTSEFYEFDFSDHVGMADDGAVSFIENTYAEGGFNKNTGRVVLREFPNATTGTFTIGAPIGHRWRAYLVTTVGEMNTIQFVTGRDADGNPIYSNEITGTVGEPVTFNVASKMSAGNEQREAVLQVTVSLDYGGISVPVNILEGGSYGAGTENITFIQNAR